jgi:hypothetical protein
MLGPMWRRAFAAFLAASAIVSCTRRAEETVLDAQPVASAEGGSGVDAAPPSAPPTASAPVDAGPCRPTALTSSARLVSDILPCDGACPVYRLTLHGDGTVEYDGTSAKVTGHRETKLDRKATDALFARAECGTFAVPAGGAGRGSGMLGLAEAVVTLDVGEGPRTLRAQRARACATSQDARDRAVCELSYELDEAAHVEAWLGYLPRDGPRALARDH